VAAASSSSRTWARLSWPATATRTRPSRTRFISNSLFLQTRTSLFSHFFSQWRHCIVLAAAATSDRSGKWVQTGFFESGHARIFCVLYLRSSRRLIHIFRAPFPGIYIHTGNSQGLDGTRIFFPAFWRATSQLTNYNKKFWEEKNATGSGWTGDWRKLLPRCQPTTNRCTTIEI
jgi:hypothetical protein